MWFEHPAYGRSVDIAALKIPEKEMIDTGNGNQEAYVIPAGSVQSLGGAEFFSALRPWHRTRRHMGEDLYVLGFPFGINVAGHFPIWKRASVASEMDLPIKQHAAFLTDAATRDGMSGALVVYIDRSGPIIASGTFTPGRAVSFVGVYSGRDIGNDKIEAQSGIVWYEELIREVIEGEQHGRVE